MSHLAHRFHWMFVPLFSPATGTAVAVGAAVPARLAALDAYRRLGHVPSAILCTPEQYGEGAQDDELRAREPAADEIDWTGFDEALTRLDEPDELRPAVSAGRFVRA